MSRTETPVEPKRKKSARRLHSGRVLGARNIDTAPLYDQPPPRDEIDEMLDCFNRNFDRAIERDDAKAEALFREPQS